MLSNHQIHTWTLTAESENNLTLDFSPSCFPSLEFKESQIFSWKRPFLKHPGQSMAPYTTVGEHLDSRAFLTINTTRKKMLK